MAHGGWKWKTKQNIMWFSQTPIMSMYDLDVVSDVVPDVVPHLNGLPSKQFKARIRCGGAANYGPRITKYIAEYYGVFNTAHFKTPPIFHSCNSGPLCNSVTAAQPHSRHGTFEVVVRETAHADAFQAIKDLAVPFPSRGDLQRMGRPWENHRKTIGKWWFNGI